MTPKACQIKFSRCMRVEIYGKLTCVGQWRIYERTIVANANGRCSEEL